MGAKSKINVYEDVDNVDYSKINMSAAPVGGKFNIFGHNGRIRSSLVNVITKTRVTFSTRDEAFKMIKLIEKGQKPSIYIFIPPLKD